MADEPRLAPPAFLDSLRPARATVDLTRLAANYGALAAAAPVPVMPVVKADAYGHGAVAVARRLTALGAPMLAVAYVEEAVALRQAGISVPIVVLVGATPGQMPAAVDRDLSLVVGSAAMLRRVLTHGDSRRLSLHLKVDTGMTRLGLLPDDAVAAAEAIVQRRAFDLAGVLTHLASADEDPEATRRQLDLFDDVLARLASRGIRPRWVHVAGSAGMSFVRPTHTLVRPGILLYGVRPRPLSPEIDVKPVMTLSARLLAVKDVGPGTAVSYGGRFTTSRPSRIAVVPLGYADGVPRTAAMSERGWALVRGAQCRVVGRVCMDLMMLDVTDVPGADESCEAVLMGDSPGAWDVADWAGTNAWDALTRIGPRVPRVYVENGAIVGVSSRHWA